MESKKRMMTGSGMARESRGPFVSDGKMASRADRESMEKNLPMMPFDEMSTTGAMTRVTDVPRSYRPKARPEGLRERAEQRRMQELEERGMRSQERESKDFEDFGSGHQGRPVKKFKDGGKVNGFPDLNKDGKITKADILKGRGVDGFADGGMVRGCKPGQSSGTKFTGTF